MGGTFDPIHHGHLVTAEEARSQFKLDKVVFMPTGDPPHKSISGTASAEDRYLMTVLATAGNPFFEVSRVEIDRVKVSHTIETLQQIAVEHPRADLHFITGADAILEILTWKDADKLGELCSFIAATRPGYSLSKFEHDIKEAETKSGLGYPSVETMSIPALSISSTDVRVRVRDDRPIRYLVPESVAGYIKKEGLYGA